MFKSWKIRSNTTIHGLEFAATKYKEECRREGKVANFDAFYFALFGRYPTRHTPQQVTSNTK